MLELKNYSFEYTKGKKVINDLDLKIEDGDICAFVGRNGAGKTTTIKSIVGISHITDGKILLDGIDIEKDPLKYKQELAYIPDNPILYDYLTGIQYLEFIADMYEVTEKNRRNRIEKYAKEFELYDELGNLISSYSHGMKQKLVLIGALVHSPKLYVLDEPFVGLDPKSAFTLKKILKEEAKNGKIVFFSTHVLDVAEKLCNKIAIIKDGKLVVNGQMDKVTKDKSLEDIFMELISDDKTN